MTDTTTASGLDQLTKIYLERMALDRLVKNFVFHNLATKKAIPLHSGNVVEFFRYANIDGSTATIAEGTLTAGSVQLSATSATLTLSEYGQFISLSRTALDTHRSPDLLKEATEVLTDAASDTVDMVTRARYLASATQLFASADGTTKTSATIASTDVLSTTELRRLHALFVSNNVRAYQDGKVYAYVMHPFCAYDLLSDDSLNALVDVQKYGGPEGVKNVQMGYKGIFAGFKLIESPNVLTVSVAAGAGTAYQNYASGANAVAAAGLGSENPIKIRVAGPESGGIANPYGNLATISYYIRYGTSWIGADGPRAYRHVCVASRVA